MRYLTWIVVLVLSLGLHGLAAMSYMAFNDNNVITIDGAGESGLEVELGQIGTYSEMANSLLDKEARELEAKQPAPIPMVEEKVKIIKPKVKQPKVVEVEEILPEVVKPVVKKKNNVSRLVTKKELPKALKTDYVVVAEVKKQTIVKPVQKPLVEKVVKKEPEKEISRITNNDQKVKIDQEVKSRFSNKTSSVVASGSAKLKSGSKSKSSGAKNSKSANKYYRKLFAWLKKHQRYPAQSKKEKQEATVTLKFSINSRGIVLAKSIVVSSGYPLLDQSALQMLEDAAPLPQPPRSLKRDRLTLQFPIEYSLITNNLYRE